MNNKQHNTTRSMKPTSEKDLLEKNTQRIDFEKRPPRQTPPKKRKRIFFWKTKNKNIPHASSCAALSLDMNPLSVTRSVLCM